MKNNNSEIISCICLTCGVRNDHSMESGYCQNGHDDWLEYRDVMLIDGANREPLDRALKLTGLSEERFREMFLDNSINKFNVSGKSSS